MDSSKDYSEDNTMISVKIQFFAIEIARNREGFNAELRRSGSKLHNFYKNLNAH